MKPHEAQDAGRPVTDVRLERYRLGELPEEERDALARRIASDPDLQRRLSKLDQSDVEIAASYPADKMAGIVRERARRAGLAPAAARGQARRWLVPATVAAACVCVLVVVGSWEVMRPAVEDTTLKGGGEAAIVLHRRVDGGSQELSRGATARQGDQIRIGYRASQRPYGAILSIDGRGTVTQHLPRTGDQAAALEQSGTTFLDFAYELDDAPRWEVFYFVTADSRFDLEPVRRALRAAGSGGTSAPGELALPAGLSQVFFPLSKDGR